MLCAKPVLKYFSGTPPENSGGTENAAENSGTNSKNFFCYTYVRIEFTAPGLGRGN
jgi:hypothetical protein